MLRCTLTAGNGIYNSVIGVSVTIKRDLGEKRRRLGKIKRHVGKIKRRLGRKYYVLEKMMSWKNKTTSWKSDYYVSGGYQGGIRGYMLKSTDEKTIYLLVTRSKLLADCLQENTYIAV